MKKSIFILIAVLILFSGCSIQQTIISNDDTKNDGTAYDVYAELNPTEMTTIPVTETESASTATATAEIVTKTIPATTEVPATEVVPTTETITEAAKIIYSKEDLTELLKQKTSGEILSFDYYDYDADGTSEVFAFVGTGESHDFDAVMGELRFVNNNGAQKVAEKSGYLIANQIYTFGTHKFVILSEWYQTGDLAYIYGVKNGKPYKSDISKHGGEFTQTDNINFTMVHSTYDAVFMDGIEIGHTWKEYYFYWDESSESFKEYGGIKITETQLLKCGGAQSIIDEIKSSGNIIGDIFYRANNIINVNYSYDGNNLNAVLLLENGAVTQKYIQEGVYSAALIPDVAVYPKSFPVG